MRSMKVVAWVCVGLLVVVLLVSGASADTRGRLFINKFVYGDPDTPPTCKQHGGVHAVAVVGEQSLKEAPRLRWITIEWRRLFRFEVSSDDNLLRGVRVRR